MSARTQEKVSRYLASTNSWLRLRDRQTGRIVAYGLPSESKSGLFHRCTPSRCDCRSFAVRGRCSHAAAAAQYVEMRRQETASTITAQQAADDLYGAAA